MKPALRKALTREALKHRRKRDREQSAKWAERARTGRWSPEEER